MTISALCTVKNGGGSAQVTPPYATATPGATITIALANTSGVRTWTIQCTSADETTSAASITLTVDSVTKTATFVAPAAGKAMLFLSTVTNSDGTVTASTTFKVATLTAAGYAVGAVGEVAEHNGTYGSTALLNQIIRATSAPVGGVGLDIIAPLTITGATSSTNVDTLALALPADLLMSALIVKVTQAMVGAGGVVLSVGTSAGGQQFMLNQTINAATAVGTRYGIATAQLGASFDSAKSYNAELLSGSSIYVRLACTAVISTPLIVQVRIFGAYV